MTIDTRDFKRQAVHSAGFLVAEFPDRTLAYDIVPKRRGATLSLPLANWDLQIEAQRRMFERFGLGEFVNCTTVEMRTRPVPHVFEESSVRALTDLHANWCEFILQFFFSQSLPPVQTLTKESRLGWPTLKTALNKRDVLDGWWRFFREHGVEFFNSGFHIYNVRLQAESETREREFLAVSRDGEVFPFVSDLKRRTTKTPIGLRVASRTRDVFNPTVLNLMVQPVDTMLHNAQLKHPVYHHNLHSSRSGMDLQGNVMAVDVKHFERHTAVLVRQRCEMIGGIYAEVFRHFASLPFLCPSDDWKAFFLLWPDRERGFSEQFASGFSPVAPVQKEVFFALYSQFAVEHFHMSRQEAANWFLAGGDARLQIKNYGDDQAWGGDPAVQRDCFAFLSHYLTVEEESPAKFLGFLAQPDGWRLGVDSYLLRTYLNERLPGSAFRQFPCYGWQLKRMTYAEIGVPEIRGEVFPFEDQVLADLGMPWTTVLEYAAKEQEEAGGLAGITDPLWVLGKDYLMTAEQKLATGAFEGYTPEQTGEMIEYVLGDEARSWCPWISQLSTSNRI